MRSSTHSSYLLGPINYDLRYFVAKSICCNLRIFRCNSFSQNRVCVKELTGMLPLYVWFSGTENTKNAHHRLYFSIKEWDWKEILRFWSAAPQLMAVSASAAISQIELINLLEPPLSRSSAQAATNNHQHSKQLGSTQLTFNSVLPAIS